MPIISAPGCVNFKKKPTQTGGKKKKSKQQKKKKSVDYFNLYDCRKAPRSSPRSLCHASLLSPCWGVPDLFPHCQSRSRTRAARLPGLLLQQQQRQDWSPPQSRRPAREGRERGGRSHLPINFMRDLIRQIGLMMSLTSN